MVKVPARTGASTMLLPGEDAAGRRVLALERPAVEQALGAAVTGKLLVTEAGFAPPSARYGRSRPHGATEHMLLVCTDGAGRCRIGGQEFHLGRGGAAVLAAHQAHDLAAAPEAPWTVWWFHFTGADAPDLVATARAAMGGPVAHVRDPAPVASLVAQVIDALGAGPGAAAFTRAAGAAWYALAQVIAARRRGPAAGASPVERAVEHLRATSPQRTSAAALASMVGLSASQLGHAFRSHVGVTPLQFQVQLRMARARELLEATDLPIARVAGEAGYADPMYFSRQFTRVHGVTPSKYRRHRRARRDPTGRQPVEPRRRSDQVIR